MQRKNLRFGEGFRVALANARGQAAEMVIAPGDSDSFVGRHAPTITCHWLPAPSARYIDDLGLTSNSRLER